MPVAMDMLLDHITNVFPEIVTECRAVIADFALCIAKSCARYLPNTKRIGCGMHLDQ